MGGAGGPWCFRAGAPFRSAMTAVDHDLQRSSLIIPEGAGPVAGMGTAATIMTVCDKTRTRRPWRPWRAQEVWRAIRHTGRSGHLVAVVRTRWRIEKDFHAAKSLTGLDHGRVTCWNSWMRWSLIAAALLVVVLTAVTPPELLVLLRTVALPAPCRDLCTSCTGHAGHAVT